MARYSKQTQHQPIDMFSPINLEFYSNILDKAQGNLNQGAAMQAKFLEGAYGEKYIDKATRDKYVGEAEKNVAGLLDADFISPASVVKGITKATQDLNPWRNANLKQLEEVKRQQDQQDRWGSNWIGNNVAKMSLTDPETGELISADKIRAISGNREDLTSAFGKDLAGLADKITEIPGGWSTILGGKAYEKKTTKIKGLTEDERVALLNEGKLVKQYMEQLPGFAEAVKASGMNPEEYIAKELDTWTKQLVKGEEVDSKYLDNPGWVNPNSIPPPPNTPNVLTIQDPYEIKGINTNFNLDEIGTIRKRLNSEYSRDPKMRASFKNIVESGSMQKMMDKYPDLYDKVDNSKKSPQEKANYFLDLVAGAEAGRIPSNAKGTVTAKSNRYYINDPSVGVGITNALIIGNPSLEIESENGNKATLGSLAKAKAIPTFKENGDIIVADTEDKYVWNVSDDEVMSSINSNSHSIIKAQRDLYKNRWATTPTKEPILTNAVEVIPGIGKRAYVGYIVIPSDDKNANNYAKVYYTGYNSDGKPDLVTDNGELVGENVSFENITKAHATALGLINAGSGSNSTGEAK